SRKKNFIFDKRKLLTLLENCSRTTNVGFVPTNVMSRASRPGVLHEALAIQKRARTLRLATGLRCHEPKSRGRNGRRIKPKPASETLCFQVALPSWWGSGSKRNCDN